MSIVKNTPHILKHSRSGWTTLQNKTIDAIKDPGALGIYVYLASKSENWDISETNLQNRFNKGRDYIRARLSELKAAGLLKTHAIKDDKGKIIRWESVLYNEVQITDNQEPGKVHITENPESGKPRRLENPPTTKERYKQNIKSKIITKESGKTSRSSVPDEFFANEAHAKLAVENNLDLEKEKTAFIDYYKAHGKTMANWNAAFNNWLRRSSGFSKNTKPHPVTSAISEMKELMRDKKILNFLN